MQTVTSPEDPRRASGRAALAAAGVAVLASLLVLGVAPRVRAQQDPPGCSGAGLTINSPFVERADGSNAGAGTGVSPCETLVYRGILVAGSAGTCCFQGGTPTITTPDGIPHDVTPPGGVPEKCPGDVPAETLTVQYQVRSQDVVNGTITARFDFTAAESFTGTPPSMGVPSGSASVPNRVQPCPAAECCDPNLGGTGADTGRKGLCTTSCVASPTTTTSTTSTTTTTTTQAITTTTTTSTSATTSTTTSTSPPTTTSTTTTRPHRPTTTTTLLPCGGVFPHCGGSCPGGMRCVNFGRTHSCVCR